MFVAAAAVVGQRSSGSFDNSLAAEHFAAALVVAADRSQLDSLAAQHEVASAQIVGPRNFAVDILDQPPTAVDPLNRTVGE